MALQMHRVVYQQWKKCPKNGQTCADVRTDKVVHGGRLAPKILKEGTQGSALLVAVASSATMCVWTIANNYY